MTLLVLASAILLAFLWIEHRSEHPILPLDLFRNRIFTVSVLTSFFTAFAMFGAIIYVPLVFQGVLKVSATYSGTLLTPMMLGLIAASTLTGWLMTRVRYYRFLGTGGVLVMMVGVWLLTQVTVTTPALAVTRDIVIIGIGLGTTFPLYLTAIQAGLP